ncbi:hypothetical protein J2789_004312 [Variovorax paradoxus]|uniref:hypothetical protein n=1 Tax=Variovorax atrisoli TaxID=3394203 RepID=UPI0011996EA7|nr:hypothetical protein [Variovorax paradoxus]MDR6521625.1 hypothetical protein [Variovorax paradoxus]
MTERCIWIVCFIPLDATGTKFFGFSEFLAGLALLVLVWTLADIRYKFRIQTAPLPLQTITFWVVLTIGILTLLTDLWRTEGWLVPKGNLLTPGTWQGLLGAALLLTFLAWAWFAFIDPPRYGVRNAKRFANALYSSMVKSAPEELGVIADELARSTRTLVRLAPEREKLKAAAKSEPKSRREVAAAYANDILLLIADKRFCRVIVRSAPGTAWALFSEVQEAKKYRAPIATFGANIVRAAIENKDSFLFHEGDGYASGLLGYQKPLSQAIFSNFELVEAAGTLLDPEPGDPGDWDEDQWQAYCRVVCLTFRSFVVGGFHHSHSFSLYRAFSQIERACGDLYKLNGQGERWEHELLARVYVVVKFIQEAIKILDQKPIPSAAKARMGRRQGGQSFYDYLARLIFELIHSASAVRAPYDICWHVQHNSVWSSLFHLNGLDTPAGKLVKAKVRRLLYEEIVEMEQFPNFKGAKILGLCLNVLGLQLGASPLDPHDGALQRVVLAWTKRNYVRLHAANSVVAAECLVDRITYEADGPRLVNTYPVENLRTEARRVVLELDRPAERQ